MRYFKLLIAVLMLVFIFEIPLAVSAIDTGLTTQSLQNREKADIMERRVFTEITSYTPLMVKCFDVRDDNMVVIGANSGDMAVIAVYDENGAFQYGFETKEPGSFRVMWSAEGIAYYSIRSGYLFQININGEITDIRSVARTRENSSYDQKVLLAKTRTIETSTYYMTNESSIMDTFSSAFKKIIRTDTEGTTVIYNASSNYYARIMGGLVVVFLVASIVIAGGIAGIKKNCKKRMIN